MRIAIAIGLCSWLIVGGCGSDGPGIVDAARPDGRTDGGNDVDADGGGTIDASAIDAPAIDAPAIDAPAIDAPAIDASATDASATDASAVDTPDVDAPDLDAPIDTIPADTIPIDAPVSVSGCADDTREGLTDLITFPRVAACGGVWTGNVATAQALCGNGWHVCVGPELPVRAVTYAQATAFSGCFAFDTAQDNGICFAGCSAAVAAGVDTADNIDMGGMGNSCPFQFPVAASCLANGRIDHSENSGAGTGCNFRPGISSGVVCCAP